MHVSSAGSDDDCARIRIAPGGVRSCCARDRWRWRAIGAPGPSSVDSVDRRYRYKYSDDQTFHFLRTSHTATSHSQFHTARSRRGSGNNHGGTLLQKINILLYCLFAAVTLSSPPPTPGPVTSSPRAGLHRAGLGCGVQAAAGQEIDVKNIVYVVEDAQHSC